MLEFFYETDNWYIVVVNLVHIDIGISLLSYFTRGEFTFYPHPKEYSFCFEGAFWRE
jgi:hypothetical protein